MPTCTTVLGIAAVLFVVLPGDIWAAEPICTSVTESSLLFTEFAVTNAEMQECCTTIAFNSINEPFNASSNFFLNEACISNSPNGLKPEEATLGGEGSYWKRGGVCMETWVSPTNHLVTTLDCAYGYENTAGDLALKDQTFLCDVDDSNDPPPHGGLARPVKHPCSLSSVASSRLFMLILRSNI